MAIDFPNTPTNGQLYTVGNTTWQYSTTNTQWNIYNQTGAVSSLTLENIVAFNKAGPLTAGYVGITRFPFPFAATILGVTLTVNTAPTGASIIVDVNKNGTTIFTTQGNRPTIAASSFSTASEATGFSISSIAAGDYITFDIDQVGSTIAGSDLTAVLRYQRIAT